MSLRLRLTLLNSLILLLVAGTLVTAVYEILARGLERQIDESLREEARLYGSDVSVWFYREARRPAGLGAVNGVVSSPGAGAPLPAPSPPAAASGPAASGPAGRGQPGSSATQPGATGSTGTI